MTTYFDETETLICPCCGRYITEAEAEIFDSYCEQCFEFFQESATER